VTWAAERFEHCEANANALCHFDQWEATAMSEAAREHHHSASNGHHAVAPGEARRAAIIGLQAVVGMLGFYFVVLALVSGWEFTFQQFEQYWPYIVALATGFGVQVGLFVYLRRAIHNPSSGKVVATTGATSGATMVSCCTHYLANLAPALGATGLVTFVGQYQTQLFWFGIAANLAGIAYIGSRVVSFTKGA